MSSRSHSAFAVLAVCVAIALVAWFAREPDAERVANAGASAPEAPHVEPKLASDALALAESSERARLEVVPARVESQAAAPTRVHGRVIGPDGTPLVGARVRLGNDAELALTQSDPTATIELGHGDDAARTNPDGRFSFVVPAGSEALIVGPVRPGFMAERRWTIARAGEECVLTMLPIARTELIVEASNARTFEPLSTFEIAVVRLDRSGAPIGDAVRAPGNDGVARTPIEFLGGAAVEVEVAVPAMAIGRSASTVRVVTPTAGEELHVRFAFDPLVEPVPEGRGVVTGIVVDRGTSEPLAGVALATSCPDENVDGVVTRLEHYRVKSDLDGRFRIALAEGEKCTLGAGDSRHRTSELGVQAGDDVRVELDRGATLVVHVVDGAGQPVKARSVHVMGAHGDWQMSANDAGVATREDLPEGRFTVFVERSVATEGTSARPEAVGSRARRLHVILRAPDDDSARIVELESGKTVEVDFVVEYGVR